LVPRCAPNAALRCTIAQDPTYGEGIALDSNARPANAVSAKPPGSRRWMRLAWPAAGASIAAGVAAVSILWLRGVQGPVEVLQADTTAPSQTTILLTPETAGTTVALDTASAATPLPSNGEPERYSTPAPSSSTSIVPPARLANYVVAHSEYSAPLSRRMALLGIVGAEGSEAAPGPEPAVAEDNDAN
jgi:hypothetical protein